MSDDPADDTAVRAVLVRAQREIEAAARETSRLEAKWDGYCGLVQACEEDERWGDVLRSQQQQGQGHEDSSSFSPEALSALRSRLETLRCAAVSAAVVPARAVGRGTNDEEEKEAKRLDSAAASDAAYAAAIERVKAGDMPGAAARLRDALFVEERPRAKDRIQKYLRAVEARIL